MPMSSPLSHKSYRPLTVLTFRCSSLLVRSPRTSEIMDGDKISAEIDNDIDWGTSDLEETSRIRSDSEKSDSDTSHVEENLAQEFSEEDNETPELGSRNSDVGCCEAVLKSQSSADEDPISSQGVRLRRKKSEIASSHNVIVPTEIAPTETNYVPRVETDFYHVSGEQSEVLGDENRSLLWFLVKQVRPGMDLSRVVLPTFILEPPSFLEKLSDYYYHADLLSRAVQENDAYLRMQSVLRWYLSGFYKKPKGLKKPYNPILGETYRCYWEHQNGSRTFYLAEQVSRHPPVSAFYVSNKKDGYVISSAILAKSKFYGNSTSAILEGQATLTMLPRGETYVITMPYAHCKGILVGTLSMELGGNVSIICEKTGYFTELDFKLKGFMGGAGSTNAIYGKIKLGRETITTVEGHWDSKITLKNKRTGDGTTWRYRHEDLRPWDDGNDLKEFEHDYTIEVHRRHQTPIMRTSSLISVESKVKNCISKNVEHTTNGQPVDPLIGLISSLSVSDDETVEQEQVELGPLGRDLTHDQVVPAFHHRESNRQLIDLLRQLLARQIQQSEQIEELQTTVASIQARLQVKPKPPKDPFPITNTILAVIFAIAMQILMITYWFGDGKLFPDITRKRN